jgi:hypothetical protein
MSSSEPQFSPWLARLQEHFRAEHYGRGAAHNYPYAVREFLRDLERRRRTVESVSPTDLERYLDSLNLKRRRGLFPDHSRHTKKMQRQVNGLLKRAFALPRRAQEA